MTTWSNLRECNGKKFPTEGYECKCRKPDCVGQRWVWNSQITFDKSNDVLKAQRSQCFVGSVVMNARSNKDIYEFRKWKNIRKLKLRQHQPATWLKKNEY